MRTVRMRKRNTLSKMKGSRNVAYCQDEHTSKGGAESIAEMRSKKDMSFLRELNSLQCRVPINILKLGR